MIQILLWCLGVLFLGYTLIMTTVTLVKAKRDGIIAFRNARSWLSVVISAGLLVLTGYLCFDYSCMAQETEQIIAESSERGAAAFTEYEGWNASVASVLDNEEFVQQRVEQYQKKVHKNERSAAVYGMAFLCYLSIVILSFGVLTEKGWYPMTARHPRPVTAKIKDDRICFYYVKEDTGEAAEQELFRYRNTEKRREQFVMFLVTNAYV